MRASIGWIVALSSFAVTSFGADESFFQEAARAGMAEVALGELATGKGSTDRVKTFGRLMVEEHGAANAKLKAAAAKSGVTLPSDLAPDALETRNKLEALSGREFDRAYLGSQREAHAATLKLLENEIANGKDAAAKAWARETLPVVKRHAENVGSADAPPGAHDVEHAAGTPGLTDSPAVR
jgi:putative membrane protein